MPITSNPGILAVLLGGSLVFLASCDDNSDLTAAQALDKRRAECEAIGKTYYASFRGMDIFGRSDPNIYYLFCQDRETGALYAPITPWASRRHND